MAAPTGQGTLGHLGSLTTMRLKHGSYSLAGAGGASANVIDFLVVAGGGSAGSRGHGGGGGGGGMRSSVTATGGSGNLETGIPFVLATNFTVTVGGGAPQSPSGGNFSGYTGTNSVFSTITSNGGGFGGAFAVQGGSSGSGGGSGGGDGINVLPGGVPTSGQGFAGGACGPLLNGRGSGGGGASIAGVLTNGITSASNLGPGGDGRATSITGSLVTYAGGGCGGCAGGYTTSAAAGGGGGTNTAGTANLGGGGGGCNDDLFGKAGGRGVVVLSWLTALGSITVGGGLTADPTGTNGLYSYKRFTDGTGLVSFA